MANLAKNAIVGKPKVSGGIFVADITAVLPTDQSTALPVGFKSTGYLGDAGLSRMEKISSDIKRAWGGDPLVVITRETEYSAKFVLVEYLNPVVQEVLYGKDNVTAVPATGTTGALLTVQGKTLNDIPHKAWDIELFSGTAKGRIVFPEGVISSRGDAVYKDDDIVAREVTLTLLPDLAGNFFYEFWDDGRKVLTV